MSLDRRDHRFAGFGAGLMGRCPRCGDGRLFKGFIAISPHCSVCDLDMSFADAGDGPAVFIMMIAGAIVVGTALVVDATYEPPMLLLGAIFLPLMAIICLGMIRPLKGLLIAAQYRHKAAEGRLEL